ncbi:hypothetical protein B0H63DRAFT_104197 [Podospora didyma]|uniref:C2H2-type domain-containing protein n=1 Tax=Podospora didyma TaxID=330526 RepID=A0AAE0U3S4_9PEZI|nr:hypothetical protein B0H63DRAFT_104197 [Podospora didyma]
MQLQGTVFRLSGLPYTLETFEHVANLTSEALGDVPPSDIRVFSLASIQHLWDTSPSSKVSTVMFTTVPSIVHSRPDQNEWSIGTHSGCDLVLDTHFMAMTPLNDVPLSEHRFDCIAISGLASHPFGSWQPKGGDKTFMWIRDSLPKSLKGTRAVIYGYDTKLDESRSIQLISDLSQDLINQLQAAGWGSRSQKPVAFLAHSLGGLVLKEALVQLTKGTDERYESVLKIISGAIFFGVPSLGMEQEHFRTIVQNKPNETLVEDIARNSNYLRRLDEKFSSSTLNARLRCFWAFETSESPTVVRTADGKIDRNGPPAILVSRESATCRLVATNPSVTFPINTNHSDMVKFKRNSQYYQIVMSKLASIFQSTHVEDPSPASVPALSRWEKPNVPDIRRDSSNHNISRPENNENRANTNNVDVFRDNPPAWSNQVNQALTEVERLSFQDTSFETVRLLCREIQMDQERHGSLMYMKRLEPFMVSMQQFGMVASSVNIFFDVSLAMAHVWGPMDYILRTISAFPDALDPVLNAYQTIGEQVPHVQNYQSLFASTAYMKDVLITIYKDILWFHGKAIQQLKQRKWKLLFKASWRDLGSGIEHVKESIARSKRLMENQPSFPQFEEVQSIRANAMRAFEQAKLAEEIRQRNAVIQWLSAFDCELEQDRHRKKRSICKDPGRWLINDRQFQNSFNPEYYTSPSLWLRGIPGAGKTILASVIVDAARQVQGTTVVFFYCRHDEPTRNSLIGVARSMLAQILEQHPHLLPYFHEKASFSSDVLLTSTKLAKEMIKTALLSCNLTWIVIDGIDECRRDDRIDIACYFQEVVEASHDTQTGPVRCLFVSQDDGVARACFQDLPTIDIKGKNQKDLTEFATAWHMKLEAKFGPLRSKNCHIANILSARAQGMFIFAELFAKYLNDQLSTSALMKELEPDKLPVKLDHVYERIFQRILESKGDSFVDSVKKTLGWIVCAQRPWRWREIQAAICINMEDQCLDYSDKLLESPTGLFASLVELQSDGTVELVHETAREYLVSQQFVNPRDVDYSLALLSIAYLSFPQVDIRRDEADIESDVVDGFHSFYDYASACWFMHLQNGIRELKSGHNKLTDLRETLETFIEAHWSSTHKPLRYLKRIEDLLAPLKDSEEFDKITQTVGWAKNQSSKDGQAPSADEALDLWRITDRIRAALEKMQAAPLSTERQDKLQGFYGTHWFKCPRINCHYYHQGFATADQRKRHIDKHDRPFLCFIEGCHMSRFGCTTSDELKKHLFQYHGIDMFDQTDDLEYPDPPSKKEAPKPAGEANFQCHLCPKQFTRNHNLKSHLRTHEGIKEFACSACGEQFTRKTDCNRHERGHGEKKFQCVGSLKDGTTWGCKRSFGRPDKLADHLRSKTGQKCLRPLVLEKLKEARGGETAGGDGNMFADQVGENADALLAAGKSLPSFGEFLNLCGLNKSVVGLSSETTTWPEGGSDPKTESAEALESEAR